MDIDYRHLGQPQQLHRDKGEIISAGAEASAISFNSPTSIPSHVDATAKVIAVGDFLQSLPPQPQLPSSSSSLSSNPSSSISAPAVCKTAIQTLLG